MLPVEAALRQRGLFTGQDCLGWELDAPVPSLPPLEAFAGPKGRYETILRMLATEHLTVRQLPGRLAAGGGHWTLVGTPEQIADAMEHWFRHEGHLISGRSRLAHAGTFLEALYTNLTQTLRHLYDFPYLCCHSFKRHGVCVPVT